MTGGDVAAHALGSWRATTSWPAGWVLARMSGAGDAPWSARTQRDDHATKDRNGNRDGTLIDHIVYDATLTTLDGGGPVIFSQRGRFEFEGGSETFDPETGYLTIAFGGMVTGATAKYRAPGEGVLIRDAGRDKFAVTIVIDTATGELVSEDFSGMVSGPHPTWDGIDVVCEALA